MSEGDGMFEGSGYGINIREDNVSLHLDHNVRVQARAPPL
jgi:hypothetical protein